MDDVVNCPKGGDDARPLDEEALYKWIVENTGIKIARTSVCEGHSPVWAFVRDLFFNRPNLSLIVGPRGGGKSFLSALDTHLMSRWNPRYGTRILGASRAQSEQVYAGLREILEGSELLGRGDMDRVKMLRDRARYENGSDVAILAASSRSVRGPHVPCLKLDEVDEIDSDCREAAMGMSMNKHGHKASVVMTSTWHRLGGPVGQLLDRSREGNTFPSYTFCVFEVLERCTDERSGPNLEHCPSCPLMTHCHDRPPWQTPKAKRSDGHYSIDSLVQKVVATSKRTFEADYLCKGPKADGLWFPAFDPDRHVSELAEYDPHLPVHLAVDSGVFTGAVFFQKTQAYTPTGMVESIHVFADHLMEAQSVEVNARTLRDIAGSLCQGKMQHIWADPAGSYRNTIAVTATSIYENHGLKPMNPWPGGSVNDGLTLVESFMDAADGKSRLLIHPRCKNLISALRSYRRAKRAGQWMDYPEDPQHPHEDLVDALRGGLRAIYPEGRKPPASDKLPRVAARQVF
ncbi:hypothetical protein EP7_005244 [Isosphaeraceae bacterium EP7]